LSKDFRVITLGDSINVKKLRDDFEHTFVTEHGNDSTLIVGKDNPYYVPYDSIPKHLIYAVLLSEDGSFFRNDGFNILQIERSIADNIRQKQFIRGASTVSMQWVKNIFLSREKTLSRKFQELILTWLINKERMLDEQRDKERHKKRLLEIYLNIIEWGPDIYGIGRASEYYFNKRPSALTVSESTFLATIIPNPKKYERYFFQGQLRKSKKNYMALLARMMAGQQIISHAESLEAEDEAFIISGEAIHRIRQATRGDTTRSAAEEY
jgi:membrane peptidoglycan carboxypeptidase